MVYDIFFYDERLATALAHAYDVIEIRVIRLWAYYKPTTDV